MEENAVMVPPTLPGFPRALIQLSAACSYSCPVPKQQWFEEGKKRKVAPPLEDLGRLQLGRTSGHRRRELHAAGHVCGPGQVTRAQKWMKQG